MDPIGGNNPSNPQLDGVAPVAGMQPQAPVAGPQPAVGAPSPAPVVTAPSIDGIPTVAPAAPAPSPVPNVPAGFNDVPIGSSSLVDSPAKEPKGSGALKKVLIILGGIILVGGIAAGSYYLGYTSGKSAGQKAATASYQQKLADLQKDQAESEESTSEDGEVAELDLGSLQDPKYVDETIEGEIGKQVSASDGLVLQVTNIERNYKTSDTNYKLDDSKELVKVNFLIGNAAKDKPKDVSSFNFRLENSSGGQLTPENIADYPDKLDTVKLEVGAQTKGSIVYAVNKNEKPLKFTRSQTYRITGQNKEVTTKIVVTVAE